MAGQRGVREQTPGKRKTAIPEGLQRRFRDALPPKLRDIYKSIPDPTQPGFLALQSRLLLAMQVDLMGHYLDAERDSERMHAGRMLLDVAELLRRTLISADELQPDAGVPQYQRHEWGSPFYVERDPETGTVRPATPPVHD